MSTVRVRVLVVDEDASRVEIIRHRLGGDFEIADARPGQAAEALVAKGDYDLLICGPAKTSDVQLVGSCRVLRALLLSIERMSRQPADVFLEGEKGSGKSLVGKSMHDSESRTGDFVCHRLQDLSPTDFEGALFAQPFPGNGTVVIDGVDLLPTVLQERLARDRRAPELPGSSCRVVACSRLSVERACTSRALARHLRRQVIVVPPLRDRGEDIPELAIHFVGVFSEQLGRKGLTIGRQAMAELCAYRWPGNVSELIDVVDAAVAEASDNDELGGELISGENPIVGKVVEDIIGGGRSLDLALAELEAAVIREALEQHHGNRSAAARQLKLPRQTLQDRMKKHGLWAM